MTRRGLDEPAIRVRGLAKRFGATQALDGVDLDVEHGSIVGLLGPNGSGKSTLLRTLVGLLRADAGTASVAGALVRGDGLDARRRATFAPGEIAFYGELRAREQLAFLLRGRAKGAFARAAAIAGELELPLEARVRSYSHGMKRQLLFAAALAPDVPVRILDEPSEGLDPTKRGTLLDLIQRDAARGTAILLSSHHLGEVDRACDRLVFLAHGKKIADESSHDVAARARRLARLTYADGAAALAAAEALERANAASSSQASTTSSTIPPSSANASKGLDSSSSASAPAMQSSSSPSVARPIPSSRGSSSSSSPNNPLGAGSSSTASSWTARVEGTRVVVTLREDDPRPFLAALAAARAAPAPIAVEFGGLSLAELYRELYGVEGC